MPKKTLLVVLSFKLTEVIAKGELIARYFNPGNLFDEVHFLLTNRDQPVGPEMQASVGTARYVVHNLPIPSLLVTWGWQLPLLRNWLTAATKLAKSISPDLIRCYGNFEGGYVGTYIAKQLRVPSVLSLHTHPEANRRSRSWHRKARERFSLELLKKFEAPSLWNSDRVIIVYEAQRNYAKRLGARDIRCIYNFVNPSIRVKTNYSLDTPPKILCVSRQFERKNPTNIIRALSDLSAELTLVGSGPIHEQLVSIARQLKMKDRVHFIPAMENDTLATKLHEFDLFAVQWLDPGIPKAVIEPLLAGLPIVINRQKPGVTPEVEGNWVYSVEDTKEGYEEAFKVLLSNVEVRQSLGNRGLAFAQEMFASAKIEQQLIDLYLELL